MNIVLYSTNCPKCMILEKKLRDKNIEFNIINNVDEMIKKGFMAAPILEVDGKSMNYIDANTWINNIQ